jgi:3'-phosphoadenosine 5'-phosphosulfate sulfotransferase (PAPS reductase)/FAD synthetase
MSEHNIISVSGGKDSTALLLLAIERGAENMSAVFADTGNEHQQTYDYVQYLSETVFPIRTVKADFTRQIAGKREYVLTKWAGKGVPQSAIDRAAAALVPSGNPFLDLCVWKGRFPSTKVAFCSEELKRNPIINQVQNPLLDAGDDVRSWQGVRRDESLNRRFLIESELKSTHANGAELWNYRPILDWTAKDAFTMHRKHGIKHNPLYEQGMGRVGCMPCINCRKDELLEISKRFPEVIDRIAQWEDAVKQASKHQAATFFAAPSDDSEWSATQTIDVVVEWSKTKRGGKLYDMFRILDEGPVCSSVYGLCE